MKAKIKKQKYRISPPAERYAPRPIPGYPKPRLTVYVVDAFKDDPPTPEGHLQTAEHFTLAAAVAESDYWRAKGAKTSITRKQK